MTLRERLVSEYRTRIQRECISVEDAREKYLQQSEADLIVIKSQLEKLIKGLLHRIRGDFGPQLRASKPITRFFEEEYIKLRLRLRDADNRLAAVNDLLSEVTP